MLKGKSLVELATEIERVRAEQHDYTAPTTKLEMVPRIEQDAEGQPVTTMEVHVEDKGMFGVREHAHRQIGDRIGIPTKYYRRMQQEAPELLARNVNHWWHEQPEKRMVRTLDGHVRAFLSDRYRPMDNWLVAEAALPVLSRDQQLTVRSAELTETRLYIQATTERVQAEVRSGDVVQAGLVISNSEVGAGAVRVEPLIFRLVCINGMIRATAMRRHHVGRRIDTGDEVNGDFYNSDTWEADNRALLLKVRDTVQNAWDEAAFEGEVDLLREAAERRLPADKLPDVVEEVVGRYGLSEAEGSGVLGALIEGADLSEWGLLNAVTAQAHNATDYDRAIELERMGGQMLSDGPVAAAIA